MLTTLTLDSILSWNVRGLNRSTKQAEVRKFLQSQKVGLFGLLETKVKASKLGTLYLNLCPQWCISSNIPLCNGVRIFIGWHPAVFSVDILCCTSQLIHLGAELVGGTKKFWCTFVYGHNDAKERSFLPISIRSFYQVMGIQSPIHPRVFSFLCNTQPLRDFLE